MVATPTRIRPGMSVDTTASNLLDLVERFKEGMDNLGNLGGGSLSKMAKKMTVQSKAFVEEPITHSEIYNDLLTLAESILGSFFFVSLGLQDTISVNRTVADRLHGFSSEGDLPHVRGYERICETAKAEAELLHAATHSEKIKRMLETFDAKEELDEHGNPKEKHEYGSGDARIRVNEEPNAVGRVIEATMTENGKSLKVHMILRIAPVIISTRSAEVLIENFGTGSMFSMQRLLQLKTGEISFVNDWLFQMDKIHNVKKALKSDKTGDMYALLKHNVDKSNLRVWNIINGLFGRHKGQSKNVENAFMILDKSTVDKMKQFGFLDLTNAASRNKFMQNTNCLCLMLVDETYQCVDIALNSSETIATYPFAAIKRKKLKEDVSLKQLFALTSAQRG